jgi:hypothetical protein
MRSRLCCRRWHLSHSSLDEQDAEVMAEVSGAIGPVLRNAPLVRVSAENILSTIAERPIAKLLIEALSQVILDVFPSCGRVTAWSKICRQKGLVLFRKPNGVASCCPRAKIVTDRSQGELRSVLSEVFFFKVPVPSSLNFVEGAVTFESFASGKCQVRPRNSETLVHETLKHASRSCRETTVDTKLPRF